MTKIKIYDCSVNINFQGKGVPKEKAPCKCLSIIMLDSVDRYLFQLIVALNPDSNCGNHFALS